MPDSLFTKEKDDFEFSLSFQEKLFFLYLLVQKDEDVIAVVLQTLKSAGDPVNQVFIQNNFERVIKDRLQLKEEYLEARSRKSNLPVRK